jgi:hypothetical protein
VNFEYLGQFGFKKKIEIATMIIPVDNHHSNLKLGLSTEKNSKDQCQTPSGQVQNFLRYKFVLINPFSLVSLYLNNIGSCVY